MKYLMMVIIVVLTSACGKPPTPTEIAIIECDKIEGAEFWVVQGPNDCNIPSAEYCLYRQGNDIYADNELVEQNSCAYKMFDKML
jgi:hypothetical protein